MRKTVFLFFRYGNQSAAGIDSEDEQIWEMSVSAFSTEDAGAEKEIDVAFYSGFCYNAS